jgi:ABC-type iron transport system FetAB ATPase subunit
MYNPYNTTLETNTELTLLEVNKLHLLGNGPIVLSLQPGEILCISGSSGAGKTLLLRALADLDPHKGEMLFDGVPSQQFGPPQWRQLLAYLPAESHWWFERVGDHFILQEPTWLTQLGFDTKTLDWKVRRCSSGERQRLALLRLLCNSPRLLLLDEPTANLDPENIKRVEDLLLSYRDQHQVGMIWVTHDPQQIQRVADRHLRLEDGTLSEVKP